MSKKANNMLYSEFIQFCFKCLLSAKGNGLMNLGKEYKNFMLDK